MIIHGREKTMYLKSRRLITKTRFHAQSLLLVSLTTALTSCGGGGSGDPPPAPETNQAPSAVNQSYQVNQGSTLSLTEPGVLENSSDPEDDDLTAQVVSGPTHGTLTLNLDGSFDYVHDGSSSEDDGFTYLVNDGEKNSIPATVTIDVNGVPVTNSACIATGDLPSDLNNFVTDDDTQLTFTVLTQPTQGTLSLSTDGMLSYSLNGGNDSFRGVDSFTYQVDDNSGAMATGSVNLIVGKTRIMPLGDSITKGIRAASCPNNPIPDNEQIGYRAKLYQDLVDNGYVIDFVGNQINGKSAIPPIGDPDHQGIGGFKASDVEANITAYLTANPADIILLHIGTNNINIDDPDDTITDIQEILGLIDNWENTNNPVTVLLSTIIDRSTKAICDPQPIFANPKVTDLNTRINTTVANRKGTDDIILVDQHRVVNAQEDLSEDGVHPNEGGYNKMADEWFAELIDTNNSDEIVSLFETLKCPTGN